MRPNEDETFDNDGYFIDTNTGRKIGFDWEYRDKYFTNCKLKYSTLGQYERKLRKPSIQLAIQCDSTETGIAVGWHEDWLKEEVEHRDLSTDFVAKEKGTTRYTKEFKIYSYENIDSFKEMVAKAIEMNIYSHEIFNK
jgi:hypothetical protein